MFLIKKSASSNYIVVAQMAIRKKVGRVLKSIEDFRFSYFRVHPSQVAAVSTIIHLIRCLFMKEVKYAIHHTIKPRDITVKVIEQNSNIS